MTERWVVICGLVRDEAAMLRKLEALRLWRQNGDIHGVVWSTWHGEPGRYPDVMAVMNRYGFILVELDQPRLKTMGHFLHQSKALAFGLHAVPSGSMVLKVRPDMRELDGGILRAMLDNDLSLDDEADFPRVFNSKVLVNSFFIDSPYYINDIIFYGVREDIQKLACFDLSTEYVPISTGPEQFFFRPPFAQHFPAIEAYMLVAPSFAFNDIERATRRSLTLLASDLFLEVVANYLLVMKTYFRVGFVPDRERRPLDRSFSISELFTNGRSPPGAAMHQGAYAVFLEDERIVDALLDGGYEADALGLRFADALRRMSRADFRVAMSMNPLMPDERLRELLDQIREALPETPDRLDQRRDPDGLRFRVTGHPDRVDIIDSSDQAAALAEEVNRMRRVIDKLNADALQRR